MNPAELDFSEFRNRHIWVPADSPGSRQRIDLALLLKSFPYSVEKRVNPYPNGEDADYGTWEKALDVGRSYPCRCDHPTIRVSAGLYVVPQ
jgi:hypothetical protein